MSQITLRQEGAIPPPFVVNSYEVDYGILAILGPNIVSGVSVLTAGGVEKIKGGSGIDVYVDLNLSENIFVKIKNSTTDTGQTSGAVTIDLSTIDCTAVGTYKFISEIAAYEATGPNGAGITLYTTVISDGVNVTVIGDSDPIAHISAPILAINYAIVGSGTNAILQVTGALGFTIDWGAITVYIYRG